MIRPVVFLVGLALATTSCGPGMKGGPAMNNKLGAPEPAPIYDSPVISAAILQREPVANTAEVRHILIGWGELAGNYGGGAMDPRAAKRTKADAEAQVTDLVKQLKDGANFETLMKANSEDTGSANSDRTMTVSPSAELVIEFKQLALRLNVGEYGVCQSDYGFHIIKRYE